VDRVGHRDAHVDARPLEARESPRAVANGARATIREPSAQHLGHRMEAKDVAHLEDAFSAALGFSERSALGCRDRERLFDEARLASRQALARQAKMRVGWSHQIDRVHVSKDGAKIRHCPRGGNTRLDGEGAALLREIGDPEFDAEPHEHADVLLAPATETDQENLQWREALSPPRSSAIS
jgi:hypothetical protein